MPGMILGSRYQVQDRIGTGGMATVFRGRDEVLGRTVAIKTMLPQYATDASFAARFKQEAQAAAALQSPYIVSVYDWGKDEGTYYIVMEYLRGTDLKSGIRKHGALDCKKVAQIGSQIAQALSVAHRHDIIHRDIKPQNIMVQPDGNIKVMDFGIARAKNSHLTTDNSVLGTAHYVSPEQTQGKALAPTTDIYSLGIVMYEAATGQVPFQGDDAISVALKQVNEQPKPPSQLNPAIDPSLESIILKCMQKDPEARFQTADELARTLRDYIAGRTQQVHSATAVLPAAATSRLDRPGRVVPPVTTGATAAIPRVDHTGRFRPTSATQQAVEDQMRRDKKRRRKIIFGVLGVVMIIIAGALIAYSMLDAANAQRPVPNLLNYTQEEAEQAIKAADFEVGSVKQQWDANVEVGRVCDQSPSANTRLPKGSKIDIYLSKGAEPAAEAIVPDLRGLSPAEADKKLSEVKLKGRVGDDRETTDVEKGKVCEQDTAPGTKAKAGDTVVYHLSKGPGEIVIPKVSGDTEDAARQKLESSEFGLVVKVQYKASDQVASGKVMSVQPEEGSTVERGSTVTIVVSTGKAKVEVPNVVGLSYADAKAKLENLGFKVKLDGSSQAAGKVVEQSQTGEAAKGETITLVTQADSAPAPSPGGGGHN